MEWREEVLQKVVSGGLWKTVEAYDSTSGCRKELDKLTAYANKQGVKVRTKIDAWDNAHYYGYMWVEKKGGA